MKTLSRPAVVAFTAGLLSSPMLGQESTKPRRVPTAYRPATPVATSVATPQPPQATPSPAKAAWEKEPDAFRGVPWSSSETTTVAKLKEASGAPYCGGAPRTIGLVAERMCSDTFMVGSASVKSVFFFHDGKFVLVLLMFDSKNWTDVRDAFLEKYGTPIVRTTEPVKTRMNVEYQNEKLAWNGKTVHAELERFASSVSESNGILALQSHWEELERQRQEQKKKAAEAF